MAQNDVAKIAKCVNCEKIERRFEKGVE